MLPDVSGLATPSARRRALALAASLAAAIGLGACGGSGSAGDTRLGTSAAGTTSAGQGLSEGEASKAVEQWAEARAPSKADTVEVGACHRKGSSAQRCLYAYHAASGTLIESREAEVRREPTGYLSLVDGGPVP